MLLNSRHGYKSQERNKTGAKKKIIKRKLVDEFTGQPGIIIDFFQIRRQN